MHLVGILGAKGVGKDTLAKLFVEHHGFRQTSFARELYREVAVGFDVPLEVLQNRNTKETPLEVLRLSNCRNAEFVETALLEIERDRVRGRPSNRELRQPPGLLPPCSRTPSDVRHEAQKRGQDLEYPRSPRQILQWWGTEYRLHSAFGHLHYWVNLVRDEIDRAPGLNFVVSDVRLFHEAEFISAREGVLVRIRSHEVERAEDAARARGEGTALHSSETELKGFPVDAEVFNVAGRPERMLEELHAALKKRPRAA